MKKFDCPEFAKVQERQLALLNAEQRLGIALVQRRDDGVYVARHADGREDELPYRDKKHDAPFK